MMKNMTVESASVLEAAKDKLIQASAERRQLFRKAIAAINMSNIQKMELSYKGKKLQSVKVDEHGHGKYRQPALYKPFYDDDDNQIKLCYIGRHVEELTIPEFIAKYETQV